MDGKLEKKTLFIVFLGREFLPCRFSKLYPLFQNFRNSQDGPLYHCTKDNGDETSEGNACGHTSNRKTNVDTSYMRIPNKTSVC